MNETEGYALGILLASCAALAACVPEPTDRPVQDSHATADARRSGSSGQRLSRSGASGTHQPVEHVVTIALASIPLDRGLHIGFRRVRAAAAPLSAWGCSGTLSAAAAGPSCSTVLFGIDWYLAVLVATAVAPTDPAVVFSVLGQRQIRGRSGTILEGESGANHPVGIARMSFFLAAGALSWQGAGEVATAFVLQMVVGAVVGASAVGHDVVHPTGAATQRGAVPVAECLLRLCLVRTPHRGPRIRISCGVHRRSRRLGDPGTPYKREIERFHPWPALARSFGFLVLGPTRRPGGGGPDGRGGLCSWPRTRSGHRSLAAGLCLLPARLRPYEMGFVLFAGLKGAVPILLGEFLRAAQVPDSECLYGIVVVRS